MASNWVKVKTKPIRNLRSTVNGTLILDATPSQMASNWVKVKTKPIRNPKSTVNGILTNPRCLDAENHVKGSSYSVHQTAAHSGGSRREAWKEALLRHAAADRREQVGGRAEAPAAEHLRLQLPSTSVEKSPLGFSSSRALTGCGCGARDGCVLFG